MRENRTLSWKIDMQIVCIFLLTSWFLNSWKNILFDIVERVCVKLFFFTAQETLINAYWLVLTQQQQQQQHILNSDSDELMNIAIKYFFLCYCTHTHTRSWLWSTVFNRFECFKFVFHVVWIKDCITYKHTFKRCRIKEFCRYSFYSFQLLFIIKSFVW